MKDSYEHLEYKENEYNPNTEAFEIVNKKFIHRWFQDVNKQIVSSIGFYPPPEKCPENVYNLWKGWSIESHTKDQMKDYTESREFIKGHYKYICGDGWEYALKVHACIAQKPGFKNGIMMTYQSDAEGIGKTSMFLLNEAYMGDQYTLKIKDAETELLGNFNALSKHKIYIFLEEFDGNDGKGKAGRKLMEMITSTCDNITHKGKDTFKVKSVAHYEASTNIIDPKKISDKNRRDVFYRIEGKPKSKEYFEKLYSYINDKDTMRDWYDYLMTIDTEHIDWIRDRPVSEYFDDLVEASQDLEFKFLVEKIVQTADTIACRSDINEILKSADNVKNTQWSERYKTTDLFKEFREYIDKKKVSYATTDVKFGIKLLKYRNLFAEKGKTKGCTTYTIHYLEAIQTLIKEETIKKEDFPWLDREILFSTLNDTDNQCCLFLSNWESMGDHHSKQCKHCQRKVFWPEDG